MRKVVFILVMLATSNMAFGAEIMKANERLTQDSLVFTLEEGHKVQEYISQLEAEKIKQEALIAEYKNLDAIHKLKVQTFESYLENKDAQIAKYIELKELDENRVKELTKQSKARKLENTVYFTGGILATIGLILVADKIDDGIEDSIQSGE